MDEDMILEEQSFDAIMERLLTNVPEEGLDTREGSIIYNALAPRSVGNPAAV